MNHDQVICFGRKIKVDPSKVKKLPPLPIGFRLKIFISPKIIGSYFLAVEDMDPYGLPDYLYVSEFWEEEDLELFKRMWKKIKKSGKRIVVQLIKEFGRWFWKIQDKDNNVTKIYESEDGEISDGERFLEEFLKESRKTLKDGRRT